MDKLKETLIGISDENTPQVNDRVEVVGLSISSCLNRASAYLGVELSRLDYEILQRGKKTFLNLNNLPFRILVRVLSPASRFADLEEFSQKIGAGDRLLSEELDRYEQPKDRDGRILVRLYRSGVYVTVFPPAGTGRAVDMDHARMRLQHHGVHDFDDETLKRAVDESSSDPIKVGEFKSNPDKDSSLKVDISPDEMKAFVKITPPGPGGRHLEVQDVINALKGHGVIIGFLEKEIKEALEADIYMQDIQAARGIAPKHGEDGRIEYKVDVHKDRVNLEEDASGRVDYKKMNLVENVVVGQILAEKIPPSPGKMGRTLFNRMIEARDGKDIELKAGRNTILSDDGNRVIAEINGQVVFAHEKLNVDPVYRVQGDVGPRTGNIMFLGSIVITGNVLDNYEVKAAGNIEVQGSVQKARIEAEGDIVVKQGIVGREGAQVETTGGSLMARFIQSAEVKVSGDVIVQEGILHSNMEAGGNIICNGRRAQVVGGTIRARKEIRARMIGSQAYTATDITVGTDPRLLAQSEELNRMLVEAEEKGRKSEKTLKTLNARKTADPEAFTEDQEEQLKEMEKILQQVAAKKKELDAEITRLNEYMDELGAEGKVHAEKEIFPGVTVHIKEAALNISDTYNSVSLYYEGGYVKIGKLEKNEEQLRKSRR